MLDLNNVRELIYRGRSIDAQLYLTAALWRYPGEVQNLNPNNPAASFTNSPAWAAREWVKSVQAEPLTAVYWAYYLNRYDTRAALEAVQAAFLASPKAALDYLTHPDTHDTPAARMGRVALNTGNHTAAARHAARVFCGALHGR